MSYDELDDYYGIPPVYHTRLGRAAGIALVVLLLIAEYTIRLFRR